MLIGLRGKSSLQNNRLPELWSMFNSRAAEIRTAKAGINGYGVCEVDPFFDINQFDDTTESTHFIGAETFSFDHVPAGMETKVLPGGKYAVFTHKGKAQYPAYDLRLHLGNLGGLLGF